MEVKEENISNEVVQISYTNNSNDEATLEATKVVKVENSKNNKNDSSVKAEEGENNNSDGVGNNKRKHTEDATSDDEFGDFHGFSEIEAENDSKDFMFQSMKKICTDSSSDETTPNRRSGLQMQIRTDITDTAYKLPFKYGWKRELVLRAEPIMSKEKGEVYYITPNGKKLRTRHEIKNHLHDDLTINNFTLVKEAIGASPDDEIIRNAKYYNYARRSTAEVPVVEQTPPLGKRIPKPKMPKGASPPPNPSSSSLSNSSLNSTPKLNTPSRPHTSGSNVKSFTVRDIQEGKSNRLSTLKQGLKAKPKGVARCTIRCARAMGKVPQLHCKLCLCLYHIKCAQQLAKDGGSDVVFHSDNDHTKKGFICENCKLNKSFEEITSQSQEPYLLTKSNSHAHSKKNHNQQQQQTNTNVPTKKAIHNFDKNPQTIVSINGKKFIMFESTEGEESNQLKRNLPIAKNLNNPIVQKPVFDSKKSRSNTVALHNNTSANDLSRNCTSPFNFSTNFLRNASIGFEILLQTFQFLKVQVSFVLWNLFIYLLIMMFFFLYLCKELQRASCVCRMWNQVANNKLLWKTIRMKNSHVNDWEGFARTLKRNDTKHLDLRKVLMGNQDEAWREFSENIGLIDQLEVIDLCRCQSIIVEHLFLSNINLKVINAVSVKDDKIDLSGLRDREQLLEELRLRSVHQNGIKIINESEIFDVSPFNNLRHLSLTTVQNLHIIIDNGQLSELKMLESLELGFCDKLNDKKFAENLLGLTKLQRLRIEKGSLIFNINVILETIASSLSSLVQLELINCDIKTDFDDVIGKCTKLKKILLIPTYVSQSAATNFMILKGVSQLINLDAFVWVVTNELLRVTELYIDQCDNKLDKSTKRSPDKNQNSAASPLKNSDCIPILKPVPGLDDDIDAGEKSGAADVPQQVEIVLLKVVENILTKKLAATKIKLLKIPFPHTWRQAMDVL
ncbi:unnamed protein product [Diamesa serratosioi]